MLKLIVLKLYLLCKFCIKNPRDLISFSLCDPFHSSHWKGEKLKYSYVSIFLLNYENNSRIFHIKSLNETRFWRKMIPS